MTLESLRGPFRPLSGRGEIPEPRLGGNEAFGSLRILLPSEIPGLVSPKIEATNLVESFLERWPGDKCGIAVALIPEPGQNLGVVIFCYPLWAEGEGIKRDATPQDVFDQLEKHQRDPSFLRYLHSTVQGAKTVVVHGIGALVVRQEHELFRLSRACFPLPIVSLEERAKWQVGELEGGTRQEREDKARLALELFMITTRRVVPYLPMTIRGMFLQLLREGQTTAEELVGKIWRGGRLLPYDPRLNTFYVQVKELEKKLAPLGLGLETPGLGQDGRAYGVSLLSSDFVPFQRGLEEVE